MRNVDRPATIPGTPSSEIEFSNGLPSQVGLWLSIDVASTQVSVGHNSKNSGKLFNIRGNRQSFPIRSLFTVTVAYRMPSNSARKA
jgi:hypothetical protein